eukprot:GEMP01091032.1.p1 GENE.GEMP01091032.1~~GEMP01091032.1.p1  ORF type:complete len:109 (-),score=2.03 GEMP01091032.1:211-537(-)
MPESTFSLTSTRLLRSLKIKHIIIHMHGNPLPLARARVFFSLLSPCSVNPALPPFRSLSNPPLYAAAPPNRVFRLARLWRTFREVHNFMEIPRGTRAWKLSRSTNKEC